VSLFAVDIRPSGDVYAMVGEPVRLACQLNNYSTLSSSHHCLIPVIARAGKQPLRNGVQQRQNASQSAVELLIEHAAAEDRGNYFCYTGDHNSIDTTTPADMITVHVTSQSDVAEWLFL